MQGGGGCIALVGDAFGGRGGIALYNRDFFAALANGCLVSSVSILPRRAPDPFALPSGISQAAPHLGRIAYIQAALRGALDRPMDMVFCGHLYMAPLALLIARWHRAKLIVQMHGIEAWPRPGAGAWWSGDRRCGLGHRRLAILDLSERAVQPISAPTLFGGQ